MPAVAIIGGQWGDEGKGKIVDLLAEGAHMVVRFSGGNNAGHTVINPQGEFKMHLVPSGIFHAQATCIIGNGVVVDCAVLLNELGELARRGVTVGQLFVSDRAHLIMPYHILLDGLEEQSRGSGAIGTTKKGIGPAYVDKVGRLGIRAGDLLDRDSFRQRLEFVLEQKNRLLTCAYGAEPLDPDEVYQQFCGYGDALASLIVDTDSMVDQALERGEPVLLEGAQGTMLDIDFGTYPYVTSASSIVGGACTGVGLSPTRVDGIIGVFKAYSTRVGGGPFPTELQDETGDLIRELAHEYGTTTGRPRRCGWFDAVVGRFSTRVNGFTGFALTRLDVLDTLPSLKICTGYRLDGDTVTTPPARSVALARCQPVYEELPGWQRDISGIRTFNDLPPQARAYVQRLEELVACPASIISVGPQREQTVVVRDIWQGR